MWRGDKNDCLRGLGVDCNFCITSKYACGFNKDEHERRILPIARKINENGLKMLDIEFSRDERKSIPEQ